MATFAVYQNLLQIAIIGHMGSRGVSFSCIFILKMNCFSLQKKFKRDIANFMHSKLFIIILLSNKKENLEIG